MRNTKFYKKHDEYRQTPLYENAKIKRCIVVILIIIIIAIIVISYKNSKNASLITITNNNNTNINKNNIGYIDYAINPIKEKEWGSLYSPVRIWCMVPTLYPRNIPNIKAIAQTWGRHCNKLIFVTGNKIIIPNEFLSELNILSGNQGDNKKVEFLQLNNLNYIQSTQTRNIWEKVWKMWYYLSVNHINDAEWFLKIDDDSFFSPINFRGLVQYFNPDNSSYYIGHTLLHEWLRRNIIFNGGACYGLSRGVLRKFAKEILSLDSFRNDVQRTHDEYMSEDSERLKWEWRNYCVGNRTFAQEDPTMGICLRSIGINPINTLTRNYEQRFHIFRPNDLKNIKWEDSWFWRYQYKKIGDLDKCCSKYSISFHAYKVGDKNTLNHFMELDNEYNIQYINHKFEKPWDNPPTLFLYDKETAPEHDEYFNFIRPPPGQRIYKGLNNTRYCYKCDWFDIKQ